jgi:hypothetical protein
MNDNNNSILDYMNRKSALYNRIEKKDLYSLSALKAPLNSDIKFKIKKKSVYKADDDIE